MSRESMKRHEERVLEDFQSLGRKVYEQLKRREYPRLDIPNRATNNILYDPQQRQFVLGTQTITRSSANIRHIRSFTQLVWVTYFSNELLKANRSSTLRDLYYSSEAFDVKFNNQEESDEIVTDLEALLAVPREDFKIFPEERSAIFGDLTIEYTTAGYEGQRLNLASHPDGVMIGPALTTSEFVESNAKSVVAIETGGLFTRFIEEQVPKKFSTILVHTAGQAPRATRRLLRRLNNELGLPIYILTDGDPWGMHIAGVIISGSANAAHLGELTTPDAKWLGVWATDITRYKLPSDVMTEEDVRRLTQLENDPRYQPEFWQREIDTFKKIQRKAEQQSFSRYGLSYVVEKYLPEKLKEVAD